MRWRRSRRRGVSAGGEPAGTGSPPHGSPPDTVPGGQPARSVPASPYADFNVLLDVPAEKPGLGFGDYAAALAEMIMNSRAEFAVGIFGSWGSGKTTLMLAIQKILADEQNIVPVWFAAWRYEKEPNLILPLLDVLREALKDRDDGSSTWARDAAAAVGMAGEAFLAGLRLSAELPGLPGVSADYEPGKTMERIDKIRERRESPGPLSFYHQGFRMLSKAIEELSANGTRRVVIFIDDLDRCVPSNALDVLESMKLFFDVEGCVFVVGLDQEIAEKAVAVKYPPEAGMQPGVSGSDYVKKLFQVPFSLPRIRTSQLREYLDTIEQNVDFGASQRDDFTRNVSRHLGSLHSQDSVNPREIKRLINTYTLQLKMLSPRLGGSLRPDVVLALLCLNFRPDWHKYYEQLAADPQFSQSALRTVLDESERPESVWLAGTRYPLTTELVGYLRGPAAALLRVPDLQAYVSAAESTLTTDPWVLEARTVVSRLRQAVERFASAGMPVAEAARKIIGDVDRLFGMIGARRESSGPLGVIRERLHNAVSELMVIARELTDGPATDDDEFASTWAERAVPWVEGLDAGLLEWHRYIGLGS
jgi:hypothetical protein